MNMSVSLQRVSEVHSVSSMLARRFCVVNILSIKDFPTKAALWALLWTVALLVHNPPWDSVRQAERSTQGLHDKHLETAPLKGQLVDPNAIAQGDREVIW